MNEEKPTKTGIKEMVRDFSKWFVDAVIYTTISIPYTVPSTARKFVEIDKGNLPETKSEQVGTMAGTLTGLGMDFVQGLFYHTAFVEDNRLWYIPVATNVASGIYEIGKEVYKCSGLNKNNNKSIDDTLED